MRLSVMIIYFDQHNYHDYHDHVDETQVDRVQDVFQFGIVVFYCLQVILTIVMTDHHHCTLRESCRGKKLIWPTHTSVSFARGEAKETER